MKDIFNSYCAEVMGLEKDIENRYMYGIQFIIYAPDYNPYDDLNQMAEVVEKLVIKYNCSPFKVGTNEYIRSQNIWGESHHNLGTIKSGNKIKTAFRDFIISTMPNEPT